MTLTDELKTFDDRIKSNQAKYYRKFYHYHLKNWTSMNICLVNIWDINQEQLNKLNLHILH